MVTGRCLVGPAVLADSPDLGSKGTRPHKSAGGQSPPASMPCKAAANRSGILSGSASSSATVHASAPGAPLREQQPEGACSQA